MAARAPFLLAISQVFRGVNLRLAPVHRAIDQEKGAGQIGAAPEAAKAAANLVFDHIRIAAITVEIQPMRRADFILNLIRGGRVFLQIRLGIFTALPDPLIPI